MGKICEALEGAGISCWYAPRNVGANYAQSIVEAIRGCRVFLLVLNKESNLSAHVLNEVNCAFDRFRNHENITLLPAQGGPAPSGTAAVPEEQGRTYRLTGSMVYPDSRFVGRGRELAEIGQKLSGGSNKIFLVGMGGIGKSEIAREGYAVVEHLSPDAFNMDSGYLYIELLHRLVESNRALGDYETAVFYGRKAAGLEGRFYNARALTKEGTWGWSECHLALALCKGGELEEGEARIRHAIDLFQGAGDQWSVSFSYDVLGQIQMKKGRFEEALKLNQQCQDILRPMVGDKHRNIATALESRGGIYRAMGDAENAADCLARAAAWRCTVRRRKKRPS